MRCAGRRGPGRPVHAAVRRARDRPGRLRAQRRLRRPGGRRADRRLGGRVRRGLNRVAFGQDLPTLENTPVGELLDRIDSDVYQVGAELRGSGVRIAQSLAVGRPLDRHRVLRLVAGRRRHAAVSLAALRDHEQADPAHLAGPDPRGGGLVRPGRGDGGVDPRPGRRPDQPGRAVRAQAVRPARPRGAGPRPPGVADVVEGHHVGRRDHPYADRGPGRGRRVGADHRPHRRRPADRGLAARARLRRHPGTRHPDGAGAAERARRVEPRAAAAGRAAGADRGRCRRSTATWRSAT